MSTQKRKLKQSSGEFRRVGQDLRLGLYAFPLHAERVERPGYAASTLVEGLYFDPAPVGGGATGTMSATESGGDALASTGGVLVAGSLAVTESGADVLASTGDVFVAGTLSATESGADAFASTGGVVVSGSLAVFEAGEDALASLGAVLVTGSAAANESVDDTFSASGVEEPQARGAVGGGKLTFEQAQAIYEAQTRRQSLPDIEPKPEPRRERKDAVAPASAQESAPDFTPAPLVLPTLAPLPDFASVQARIAEAQAAQAAIGLAQLQAAQDAEAEAVAMLMMMLEAA